MIVFQFYAKNKAAALLKLHKIDANLFGVAFTAFYNTQFAKYTKHMRSKTIKVSIGLDAKDADSYGYYAFKYKIYLCGGILEMKDTRINMHIFTTLMHEMMHLIQYKIFKWPKKDMLPETDEEYRTCAAESMSRDFEKNTRYVKSLYNTLSRIPKNIY